MANGSPATHQTLGQQGGSGEDSHIHLADWTVSVAAIEKKKKKIKLELLADYMPHIIEPTTMELAVYTA